MSSVRETLIGLTDLARDIVARESSRLGMSRSAWVEWVILSQEFSAAEADALMRNRRGPGRIVVVSDAAALPPEG